MAILTVITSEKEASLAVWGRLLARTTGQELVLLAVRSAPEQRPPAPVPEDPRPTDPMLLAIREALAGDAGGEGPPVVLRAGAGPDPEPMVLAEASQGGVSLVLVGREASGGGGAGRLPGLEAALFERAPCDAMCLRAGAPAPEAPRRILVPAAGGPHAAVALRLGETIARCVEGRVTALYIEPDESEEALDVGYAHLRGILRRAELKESPQLRPRVVLGSDVREAIARTAQEGFDLMLVGASNRGTIRRVLFGTVPDRLLASEHGMAIGVVRSARPLIQQLRARVERFLDLTVPQLDRAERVALFERLESGSEWTFDFFVLITLSTSIAAIGLLQDSPAVVIGAMLVAPLMSPLLGAGLALVQGNLPLVRAAGRAIVLGFLTALGISIVIGLLIPFPRVSAEMAARGGPTLLDLAVAVLAGLAAAYCLARPGLSAALPGVAIAAALVPPIAATGIALAHGAHAVARGAGMLFGTNVVAIILGSALSLYAGGIRGRPPPEGGWSWARRSLLVLLLAAAALSVPLGSVLIARLGADRSRLAPVTPGLEHAIEETLATAGATLLETRRLDDNGQDLLEIRVGAPAALPPSLAATLAGRAGRDLGPTVRVRLVTELRIEASSGAALQAR